MLGNNTGRLRGLICPECGSRQPFNIEGKSTFIMYDDGSDSHGDVEWNLDSPCSCQNCGHVATVREFREAGRAYNDRRDATGDALGRTGQPTRRPIRRLNPLDIF